jgi:renalase
MHLQPLGQQVAVGTDPAVGYIPPPVEVSVNDVLVVGAGVAGLSCAAALQAAGARVTVVDKARGVGGRCATRRIDGQPVDHGVCFLHGVDPAFLAAIDAVDAPRLPGWPHVVLGHGSPCHPAAFAPASRRVAFVDGVNVFPKHLARGLTVHTETRVSALAVANGVVTATTDAGDTLSAPTVVLALPVEQASVLIAPLPALASALALLSTIVTHPCWTVLARYPGDDDALAAEIVYPEAGPLQLLVHDSSKRSRPRVRTLVLQARPSWSARNLDLPAEEVVTALLAQAGTLLGAWATTPTVAIAHRWRYARIDRGTGFVAPYRMALQGGARIGLAGEGFDPAGGVEAAFLSGKTLAAWIARGGSNE